MTRTLLHRTVSLTGLLCCITIIGCTHISNNYYYPDSPGETRTYQKTTYAGSGCTCEHHPASTAQYGTSTSYPYGNYGPVREVVIVQRPDGSTYRVPAGEATSPTFCETSQRTPATTPSTIPAYEGERATTRRTSDPGEYGATPRRESAPGDYSAERRRNASPVVTETTTDRNGQSSGTPGRTIFGGTSPDSRTTATARREAVREPQIITQAERRRSEERDEADQYQSSRRRGDDKATASHPLTGTDYNATTGPAEERRTVGIVETVTDVPTTANIRRSRLETNSEEHIAVHNEDRTFEAATERRSQPVTSDKNDDGPSTFVTATTTVQAGNNVSESSVSAEPKRSEEAVEEGEADSVSTPAAASATRRRR